MYAYPESYRDDVVEEQGALFGNCSDECYDMVYLVTSYMNSRLRFLMDTGDPIRLTRFGYELFEMLNEEVRQKKLSKPKNNGFRDEWIGMTYAWLQWKLSIYSKDLFKILPYDELSWRYEGLHDRDLDESCGLLIDMMKRDGRLDGIKHCIYANAPEYQYMVQEQEGV